MLLQFLLPQLPSNLTETIVFVVAGLGAIMLAYSVFVEMEERSDLIRAVGAAAVLVYSIYINNAVFSIAMGGLFLASIIEFAEIYLGLHKHSPEDLEKYKKIGM